MGSVSNSNQWQPYDTYKDCSLGICSIYCPQWCYIIFPPPPPLSYGFNGDSATDFSPLIIAIIGILASAFILVSYYTIISKYCRNRANRASETDENLDQINQTHLQTPSAGLDEALIKSITVCKYRRGDGLVEGTDCSVCLSEFEENESLRVLPKCSHAFHLPCIDTWLKSHSTCPLCRSNIAPTNFLPPPTQEIHRTEGLNVTALQYRSNDTVLVVQDLQDMAEIHETAGLGTECDVSSKNEMQSCSDGIVEVRPSSLSSHSWQGHVSVADILRDSQDSEEEEDEFPIGIGSSEVSAQENCQSNNTEVLTNLGKGKSCVIPS